ncbi:Rha family transcriptional regulator [Pseudomonas extremorientalis]|uniref:Rha family transcriptional regulator n=1 Tax=Pseudomonas extremorientalis TaxID=169669 RepID=UPI00211CD10A|nr:Rha family transcriptional regulator [Pseudomonas extremorientalis]UUN89125.1 Rha family transcriptional regulator [Pseudomonas extremorientalis]
MNITNTTPTTYTTTSVFERIVTTGSVAATTLNGFPGMSSLEIAEITGKRHAHVLRDIRKMLDELGHADVNGSRFGSVDFVESTYRDSKGQARPLTVLAKELTFTLLSRYSFKLTNLIVKRWLELEGTGFERVSVQAAVIHLVEREKDNRRAALKQINKGKTPRQLTKQEKVMQGHLRAARRFEKENLMRFR